MEENVTVKVTIQFGLNQMEIEELRVWDSAFRSHVAKLRHFSDLYDTMPQSIVRLLDLGKKFAD